MAKNKTPEIKIKFYQDANGCWCGKAYIVNNINKKKWSISVAAAPEAKARSARPFITEILEEKCAEYIKLHQGAVRVTEEDYEAFN